MGRKLPQTCGIYGVGYPGEELEFQYSSQRTNRRIHRSRCDSKDLRRRTELGPRKGRIAYVAEVGD